MKVTHTVLSWALAAIATTLLAACGDRVSVKTSYDHSTSFSNYHTYALDVAPTQLRPWGKQALEDTLRSQLGARGFTEAKPDKADLYVVTGVSTEEKDSPSLEAGRVYLPSTLGRYTGWSEIAKSPDMMKHTVGSLYIDFVDRSTHQIVFRGTGKAETAGEEKNAVSIQTAVTKIVAAFPKK